MAKIYHYTISIYDQKSLNHIGLISKNDVQQMLNDVFEEENLFNEQNEKEESVQDKEEETSNANEKLSVENIIDLGPWIFIDNSTLPAVTHKYDSEGDEDWNPDELKIGRAHV